MPANKKQVIKEILVGRNVDLYEAQIVKNSFQIKVVSETSEQTEISLIPLYRTEQLNDFKGI